VKGENINSDNENRVPSRHSNEELPFTVAASSNRAPTRPKSGTLRAASRNRWEFLLMVTPLALPNAHRIAPVNPVAMF